MVTASYCTPAMQDLHKDALEAGITIVNEVSIYTDKNILDESYLLVKHFPAFPLWEYRIA